RTPASATGAAKRSMRFSDSSMYPGAVGASPKSIVDSDPNTGTRWTGLYVRIMPDAERIASGPNRAPVRNDVPPSQGRPYTAASTPSNSFTQGSRAYVRGPVNRGASRAFHGSYIVDLRSSVFGEPSVRFGR